MKTIKASIEEKLAEIAATMRRIERRLLRTPGLKALVKGLPTTFDQQCELTLLFADYGFARFGEMALGMLALSEGIELDQDCQKNSRRG